MMIRTEKLASALYTLNGILIQARMLAYQRAPGNELADLLDAAEMLPRLIASDIDKTDEFHRYVDEIAQQHACHSILQRFEKEAPSTW